MAAQMVNQVFLVADFNVHTFRISFATDLKTIKASPSDCLLMEFSDLSNWKKLLFQITTQSEKIAVWFTALEGIAAQKGFEAMTALQAFFSDRSYLPNPLTQKNITDFNKIFPEISPNLKVNKQIEPYLRLAFYKGIFLYLESGSNYQQLGAHTLLLHSCWQWYSIVKQILQSEEVQTIDWVNEMAWAYRELMRLLSREESEIHGSIYHLLSEYETKIKTKDIEDRLRLQMVMETNQGTMKDFDPQGVFQSKIAWDDKDQSGEFKIRLHPLFFRKIQTQIKVAYASENESWILRLRSCLVQIFNFKPGSVIPQAVSAVRALAVETALKNYDFETTLRLANFLSGHRVNLGGVPLWIALLSVIVLIFSLAVSAATLLAPNGGLALPIQQLWPSIVCILVGAICILLIFLRYFDKRLLPRLILPRLIGGIFIGFSFLMLQRDTLYFSHALWSRGLWLIVLFWLLILGISGIYLYQEIRPRIKDVAETWRRTMQSILIFAFFSLVIGLVLIPFPTAAFADTLSEANSCLILGPTGWVDVKLWLSFSPMALFIGIVTQFLFEDKTITASVWPVERE